MLEGPRGLVWRADCDLTQLMKATDEDLEEMMAERGLSIDHTTFYRWVRCSVPNGRSVAVLSLSVRPILGTSTNLLNKKGACCMNARIYVLAVGTFALGTDLFVIAGVLPAIARDRSVDITVAGLLVTVFSLTYGFGAPILATFTEKISRRTLLLVVLSCFSLANVGSAIAPTFPILMATRVLAACFAALYTPTATATAVALVAPQRRGQALGIVFGGLTLSTILGVPLGSWLGHHLGWPATFLFVAGLSGLAVVALLALRLKNIPTPPVLGFKARVAPLLQPGTALALLPLTCWTCAGFTTYTYIAPFLARYTHITDPTLMLFIFGAGAVLGSWLGGYLVDRFGSTRPILCGLIVLVAIYATLPLTATTL